MKKYFILGVIVLGLWSSCKDFTKIEPQDFLSTAQYYNDEAQLQAALASVYAVLAESKIYGSNIWLQFSVTDDLTYYGGNRNPTGMYGYQISTGEPVISDFWTSIYKGIERVNLLLANMDKAPVTTETDLTNQNQIKGEALFLRGYFYFLLTDYFLDVPLKIEPTSSIVNVGIERTPSKDVYKQILADMTAAEKLVQPYNVLKSAGRISRTVVEGVLARVCLYMAGYPIKDETKYADALKWASKVDSTKIHKLNPDFKQVFINYAQDKYDVSTYGESMWEIEFWGNNTAPYTLGGRLGNNNGVKCADLVFGYAYAFVYGTSKLWNLFPDKGAAYSSDLRRDWTLCPYTLATVNGVTNSHRPVNVIAPTTALPDPPVWNRYEAKWRREYETALPRNKNNTAQNFPVLRYSDVLLMLAEAENEVNGPTEKAYKAINSVRERGLGTGNKVASIVVNTQGTGYVAASTVVTIDDNGSTDNTALATATVINGKITAITVVFSGAFYTTTPKVIINGAGTGATATAVMTIIDPTVADLPLGLSKDDFRKAVQDERGRELAGEALRKRDLVRWGLLTQYMTESITLAGLYTGTDKSYVIANYSNYNPNYQWYPIPDSERSTNSLATQNNGY